MAKNPASRNVPPKKKPVDIVVPARGERPAKPKSRPAATVKKTKRHTIDVTLKEKVGDKEELLANLYCEIVISLSTGGTKTVRAMTDAGGRIHLKDKFTPAEFGPFKIKISDDQLTPIKPKPKPKAKT